MSMPRLHPSLTRALDRTATVALWASGASLVAMTIIVGAQVFSRYVLNFSLTWVEPLAIQLMGWFIFLGAAVGVRENFHLGLDLLRYVVPLRVNHMMDAVSMVVIAVFGLVVSWYGLQLAIRTWDTTISGLGVSGAWDFAPLVFSGVLMSVFAVERLLRLGEADGVHQTSSIEAEIEATPGKEIA